MTKQQNKLANVIFGVLFGVLLTFLGFLYLTRLPAIADIFNGDKEFGEKFEIEVLDAGFVHVDVGTPDEMYVWPYFARYPLDSLTGPQMVELFKLLTAGDYDDMKIFGTYLFYRAGIAPNGVWEYFLAGD